MLFKTKDSNLVTDNFENYSKVNENFIIENYFLNKDEYFSTKRTPEYIFLHHTAGWENPYKQVDIWNHDTRGRIGTEFIIGGSSIKQNQESEYDGKILQVFPKGSWAYHLGKTGSKYMHKYSVGIELCNFGFLYRVVSGKYRTWSNSFFSEEEKITKLQEPFKDFIYWHKYSENQIKSLKKVLYFISERDDIDISEGLPKLIKKYGVKAFNFNLDAYNGKIRGVLSHSNVRKDKFDVSPQPMLIDMLVDLTN